MSTQPNPYAPPVDQSPPPTATAIPTQATPEIEAARTAHLNAETNIKTLGALLYLGSAGMLLGGMALVVEDAVIAAFSLGFGAALGLGGYWLRRLDPRGRLVYTVVGALAVLSNVLEASMAEGSYSIGAVVGRSFWPLLFIALLWGAKASFVFSPHYRDVILPATPHIKRKTSKLLIALLVILLVVLAAVIIAAIAGA